MAAPIYCTAPPKADVVCNRWGTHQVPDCFCKSTRRVGIEERVNCGQGFYLKVARCLREPGLSVPANEIASCLIGFAYALGVCWNRRRIWSFFATPCGLTNFATWCGSFLETELVAKIEITVLRSAASAISKLVWWTYAALASC